MPIVTWGWEEAGCEVTRRSCACPILGVLGARLGRAWSSLGWWNSPAEVWLELPDIPVGAWETQTVSALSLGHLPHTRRERGQGHRISLRLCSLGRAASAASEPPAAMFCHSLSDTKCNK